VIRNGEVVNARDSRICEQGRLTLEDVVPRALPTTDDDANELPVVAGWPDRARVEHYSGIWQSLHSISLSLFFSLAFPLTLALPPSRSVSPASPETLYLLRFFIFYFFF